MDIQKSEPLAGFIFINDNDNYYHFCGSSRRGGLPRGGGHAENG